MQLPPLVAGDLTMLLAIGAIMLLLTYELFSNEYYDTNLFLNKRKILFVGVVFGLMFLATIVYRIFSTL